MSPKTLEELTAQLDSLSIDDQLRLVVHLVDKARLACTTPPSRKRWSDVEGIASPSLVGEDAQAWVSR